MVRQEEQQMDRGRRYTSSLQRAQKGDSALERKRLGNTEEATISSATPQCRTHCPHSLLGGNVHVSRPFSLNPQLSLHLTHPQYSVLPPFSKGITHGDCNGTFVDTYQERVTQPSLSVPCP